jgi:hypothetical protein
MLLYKNEIRVADFQRSSDENHQSSLEQIYRQSRDRDAVIVEARATGDQQKRIEAVTLISVNVTKQDLTLFARAR